jgi:hypothetical protein
MQEQIDPERVQLGQEAHEVLQAAAEPITRPGHDHIELALVASWHRSQNCYRNRGVADVVVFDSVEVALEERPMGTFGANKGLSQMINLGYSNCNSSCSVTSVIAAPASPPSTSLSSPTAPGPVAKAPSSTPSPGYSATTPPSPT